MRPELEQSFRQRLYQQLEEHEEGEDPTDYRAGVSGSDGQWTE